VAEDPEFVRNENFARDWMNVVVGIIWQVTLVVMPIFLVIRKFDSLAVSAAVCVATTWVLKKHWYDRLED
jgi:hypothetical protein